MIYGYKTGVYYLYFSQVMNKGEVDAKQHINTLVLIRLALSIRRYLRSMRQSSFSLYACCLVLFSGSPIWARKGAVSLHLLLPHLLQLLSLLNKKRLACNVNHISWFHLITYRCKLILRHVLNHLLSIFFSSWCHLKVKKVTRMFFSFITWAYLSRNVSKHYLKHVRCLVLGFSCCRF